MNTQKWVCLVLLLLVTGCTNISSTLPVSRTITPTSVSSTIPTEKPSYSDTTIPPFPSPPVLTSQIIQTCITENTSQLSINSQGVLVLEHNNPLTGMTKPFLYNINQRTLRNLSTPGPFQNFVGVSPDRKKLFYEYDGGSDNMLALADSNGKLIKKNSYPKTSGGFWDYFSWLNSDSLRGAQLLNIVTLIHIESQTVSQATAQANLRKHNEIGGSVLLYTYNPVTNNHSELRTDWPDVYKGNALDWGLDTEALDIHYYDGANIIYDPTLTRVVYPKNNGILALINVQTSNELATAQLVHWGRLPRWSNNGDNFVLIANAASRNSPSTDEFFIVSRNGTGGFRQLTHLGTKFNYVHIDDYTWSPNGQQIAFWLYTRSGEPRSRLAILNINTGEITDLCIQGISTKLHNEIEMIHPEPVWSPDGSQIIITQLNPDDNKKYNVLIVDLASKNAYKIAENLEPVGWMTKEP